VFGAIFADQYTGDESTMKKLLILILLTATSLIGGPVFAGQVSFGIRIGPPPAPPVIGLVPASPGPRYQWIDGYWYPVGHNWRWHQGYWTRAPYQGAYWQAPHYESGQYYGGYWQGEHGRVEHNHHWDRNRDRDYRYQHDHHNDHDHDHDHH
jgi:hypothetical protein